MCVAIVLSPNPRNYRKVAQQHYNLTDEQMSQMDVHHNPPICEGGRNIPEHLYIYHPITHKQVHDKQAREEWARKSSGNRSGPRGRPPKKTKPTDAEMEVLRLRTKGHTRKEVAKMLGITELKVKRSVMECKKFGFVLHLKPGPKKGCSGQPHSEETKKLIKEKRKEQVFSQESLDKRSNSMRETCRTHTWNRRPRRLDEKEKM